MNAIKTLKKWAVSKTTGSETLPTSQVSVERSSGEIWQNGSRGEDTRLILAHTITLLCKVGPMRIIRSGRLYAPWSRVKKKIPVGFVPEECF